MTFKYLDTAIMADIANAVRERNGSSRLYRPGELAGAVLALDGKGAGGGTHEYSGIERGLVNDAVFKGIASALRLHTLSKRTYKPRDMGAAIRALDFDATERPRALLHDDGTLELNVYAGLRTDLDADVACVYEVPTGGGAPAWLEAADAIRAVDFRPSMQVANVADMSGWFEGCAKLVRVRGFDNVAPSLVRVDGMYAGCTWLDTIEADFAVAQRARAGEPFGGCMKLVGTDVALVSEDAAGDALHTGEHGVVVYKGADKRRFINANLYSGGTLTFTLSEPTGQYDCISTGRLCAGIAYGAPDAMPYHALRDRVKSVQFKRGICGYADMSLDWWFSGCDAIRGFTGWENLFHSMYLGDVGKLVTYRAKSMRHTFDGCALSSIDLTGLDPAGLVDIEGCFAGCANLRAIKADAAWELPGQCAGNEVFAGCARLVGGNGTQWSEAAVGASMAAIDRDGRPGYLSM
ncbi:hypothetical protein [Xiamenia xianingshaonis]|uniref:Uncharacterized protein n=1 Tax=Xiamenia xianingshaonis TaxID=2682776 RepID=A0A9E6MRX1_9ACTN|nr:hypothetical protein [Xiamenia xianingshaonis]NHM14454.1 hypothetical protein [Xiamenia xianingshaonis]QTU84928.1 hypothetical protein J7S26_03185 [Xiamenia xianingshaonis]